MSKHNWNGDGLYYDKARRRWRVCIYYKRRVIHRSYHPTEEAAKQAYDKAIEKRERLKAGVNPSIEVEDILNELRGR
jgi:hypothetical protein